MSGCATLTYMEGAHVYGQGGAGEWDEAGRVAASQEPAPAPLLTGGCAEARGAGREWTRRGGLLHLKSWPLTHLLLLTEPWLCYGYQPGSSMADPLYPLKLLIVKINQEIDFV